jgi:hypothetical protein
MIADISDMLAIKTCTPQRASCLTLLNPAFIEKITTKEKMPLSNTFLGRLV